MYKKYYCSENAKKNGCADILFYPDRKNYQSTSEMRENDKSSYSYVEKGVDFDNTNGWVVFSFYIGWFECIAIVDL